MSTYKMFPFLFNICLICFTRGGAFLFYNSSSYRVFKFLLVHVPLGSLPSVHFSFQMQCYSYWPQTRQGRSWRDRNAKNAFQINCRHHHHPVPVQVPTNWVSNLPHHRIVIIIAPSCGGHHQQKFPYSQQQKLRNNKCTARQQRQNVHLHATRKFALIPNLSACLLSKSLLRLSSRAHTTGESSLTQSPYYHRQVFWWPEIEIARTWTRVSTTKYNQS